MIQIQLIPCDPDTDETFTALGTSLLKAASNLLIALPPAMEEPETLTEVLRTIAEAADDWTPDDQPRAVADNRSFPGDPEAFEIVITLA